MLFDDRKLQMESAKELIQCPVHSVEPFALMLAPIYVLMKLNQKFVSVKAPLDFFTKDELDRLGKYGVFYLPKFAKSSAKFQTSGRLVKKVLTIRHDLFDLSTHEISGEVFKLIAPLWGRNICVESFFMSVFVDEFCMPLNPERMLFARENAVIRHDNGILLSGAVVFFALQLGWLDYAYLSQLRNEIYERTVAGEEWQKPKSEIEVLICDLYQFIQAEKKFDLETLTEVRSEWARKIISRLSYLKSINPNHMDESATIHGDSGFVA